MNKKNSYLDTTKVSIDAQTLFILSTSGSHSSIEKHNLALKTIRVNLVYFTFSRNISSELYAGLLKTPIINGGAITGQGLKSGILPYLDVVDELAQKIGAVNTVINKNERLYGYNTDAYGFETAIRLHLKLSKIKIRNAIIYGNGGVSGVAAFVLKKLGIQVTMSGRNDGRVKEKMSQLGLLSFKGPFHLVVNATPVSSEPLDKAAGLMDIIKDCKMVFDHNMPEKDNKINYLQNFCKANNIYFAPGKDMYTPQMIKQWKLFLDNYSNNSNLSLKVTESLIKKAWRIN